jgi:outer membrane protein assembly factor BamB
MLYACADSNDASTRNRQRTSSYGSGWSAVHADASNSDYSAVPGARDLTLAWSRSFLGNINLGPTSDPGGQLYFALNAPIGCHLFALDSATGRTVWCSDQVDRFASISSPLLDGAGHLYIADGAAMHAFDRDGRKLWSTPIVGVPLSAQFTAAGNVIFITHIGRIYLLRPDTGEPLLPPLELIPGANWHPAEGVLACATGRPQCPSANTPAIDLATNRFIFTFWEPGAASSGIRAVQVTEGDSPALTPLWTNDSLPQGSASSPDLSSDGWRIYVTDNAGGLHALDAATGREIWSFPIGYNAAGSVSTSPEGLIMPAGALNAPVLAIADRGDAAELVWRRDDWNNGGIATQAAGDVAYVTDVVLGVINDLVVVDTSSGAELDREPLAGVTGFTVGTTVGPDGMIYVPTILGQLFAFRPAAAAP